MKEDHDPSAYITQRGLHLFPEMAVKMSDRNVKAFDWADQ